MIGNDGPTPTRRRARSAPRTSRSTDSLRRARRVAASSWPRPRPRSRSRSVTSSSVCWRPRWMSEAASSLASLRVTRPRTTASSSVSWIRSRLSTTRPSGLRIRSTSCSASPERPTGARLWRERAERERDEAKPRRAYPTAPPIEAGLRRVADQEFAPRLTDEELEQRLLDVAAVLGLVPDPLVGSVENLGRDLLARVSGQAVQGDGVRRGQRHQLLIHAIRRERHAASRR